MEIEVSQFCNIVERVHKFGLRRPSGIAILPRNFSMAESREELLHEGVTQTIRALWRQAGIQEDCIEDGCFEIPFYEEKDATFLGPIVFVSAALWTQNPHAVSVALGVIANYVTEFFRSFSGRQRVQLKVVMETKPGIEYKLVSYNGVPDGLKQLPDILKNLRGDND